MILLRSEVQKSDKLKRWRASQAKIGLRGAPVLEFVRRKCRIGPTGYV